MRQRLGIAAALLSDPDLLLLDEPANGLDPAGIVAMRELLRYLTDRGKTVLVSSHILPEVQQLADIVGIIDRGRLVREGPMAELLAGGAHVRVLVRPDEVPRALAILGALGVPVEASPPDGQHVGLDHGAGRRRPGIGMQPAARAAGHLRQRHRRHQRPRVGVPVADRGRGHGSRQRHPAGSGRGLGRVGDTPMMRLLGAELLKLRRRWASYVVLGVLLVLMTLVYVLIGLTSPHGGGVASNLVIRFPSAYAVINQFIFGLGSLLAVSYAAAIGGADWNWGVLRVIVARGEGRSRYIGVKFLGLAIVLHRGRAHRLRGRHRADLRGRRARGLLGRRSAGRRGCHDPRPVPRVRHIRAAATAAIGFAVAVLLRSQVAGVVVGIVLYIGESILSTILVAISFGGSAFRRPRHDARLAVVPVPALQHRRQRPVGRDHPSSISGDLSRMLLQPVSLGAAAVAVAHLPGGRAGHRDGGHRARGDRLMSSTPAAHGRPASATPTRPGRCRVRCAIE